MVSNEIKESLKNSSWIRQMFEQGAKLKAKYGNDNVFDFSIGNPDPEPPKEVIDAFLAVANDSTPKMHGYMSNAGYPDLRESIAKKHKTSSNLDFTPENIVVTCGAAGGLNVALKTILNKDEEVIVLKPFFPEYIFYIKNAGGIPVFVETKEDFQPDVESIKNSITKNTKAIILNSPNNPTGVIYSKEILEELNGVLNEKQKEFGTNILVLSDEPYRELNFSTQEVPDMFDVFDNVAVIYSFSKSLSIPGERIGYIIASPKMYAVNDFIAGAIFSNRTLGFVNAPAFMQRVLKESLDAKVDVSIYRERRDALYNQLTKLGFSVTKPEGAFYLFPKCPIEDDVKFVNDALKYNLLLVPGRGFGRAGYFRMSYCVGMDTIKNSLPQFEKLAKDYNLKI